MGKVFVMLLHNLSQCLLIEGNKLVEFKTITEDIRFWFFLSFHLFQPEFCILLADLISRIECEIKVVKSSKKSTLHPFQFVFQFIVTYIFSSMSIL